MQVHRAFKSLTEGSEQSQAAPDTRYEVKAKRTDSSVSGRGIYLREPLDVAGPSSHTVEVLPRLREVRHWERPALRDQSGHSFRLWDQDLRVRGDGGSGEREGLLGSERIVLALEFRVPPVAA